MATYVRKCVQYSHSAWFLDGRKGHKIKEMNMGNFSITEKCTYVIHLTDFPSNVLNSIRANTVCHATFEKRLFCSTAALQFVHIKSQL